MKRQQQQQKEEKIKNKFVRCLKHINSQLSLLLWLWFYRKNYELQVFAERTIIYHRKKFNCHLPIQNHRHSWWELISLFFFLSSVPFCCMLFHSLWFLLNSSFILFYRWITSKFDLFLHFIVVLFKTMIFLFLRFLLLLFGIHTTQETKANAFLFSYYSFI